MVGTQLVVVMIAVSHVMSKYTLVFLFDTSFVCPMPGVMRESKLLKRKMTF